MGFLRIAVQLRGIAFFGRQREKRGLEEFTATISALFDEMGHQQNQEREEEIGGADEVEVGIEDVVR